MFRKEFLTYAFILAILFFLPLAAQQHTHHVLFAMTSPDPSDWELTINNIENLKKGLSPDPVDVEVVAFGPGIVFLKKDGPAASQIRTLLSDHVRFVACENAMRKQGLNTEDLVSGIVTVPAGIVEVVRKQEQGWVYIKAGR